jgi:hypothetical protein
VLRDRRGSGGDYRNIPGLRHLLDEMMQNARGKKLPACSASGFEKARVFHYSDLYPHGDAFSKHSLSSAAEAEAAPGRRVPALRV